MTRTTIIAVLLLAFAALALVALLPPPSEPVHLTPPPTWSLPPTLGANVIPTSPPESHGWTCAPSAVPSTGAAVTPTPVCIPLPPTPATTPQEPMP